MDEEVGKDVDVFVSPVVRNFQNFTEDWVLQKCINGSYWSREDWVGSSYHPSNHEMFSLIFSLKLWSWRGKPFTRRSPFSFLLFFQTTVINQCEVYAHFTFPGRCYIFPWLLTESSCLKFIKWKYGEFPPTHHVSSQEDPTKAFSLEMNWTSVNPFAKLSL